MLNEKAINEFRQIYKKKFGVDISIEEAGRRANNLFRLYLAVYGKSTEKYKVRSSSELLGLM